MFKAGDKVTLIKDGECSSIPGYINFGEIYEVVAYSIQPLYNFKGGAVDYQGTIELKGYEQKQWCVEAFKLVEEPAKVEYPLLGEKIVFPNTPENAESDPIKYNHVKMGKVYEVIDYSNYPNKGDGPRIVCESGHAGDVPMAKAQWVFAEEYFKEPIQKPHIPSAERPPLGLRPQYVVEALRLQEILEAFTRYACAGKKIPITWLEEFNTLARKLGD